MTKYCEDCKYYRRGSPIRFSYHYSEERCAHPKSNTKALVRRGAAFSDCQSCSFMREFKCGPNAKLFEPKDES